MTAEAVGIVGGVGEIFRGKGDQGRGIAVPSRQGGDEKRQI